MWVIGRYAGRPVVVVFRLGFGRYLRGKVLLWKHLPCDDILDKPGAVRQLSKVVVL